MAQGTTVDWSTLSLEVQAIVAFANACERGEAVGTRSLLIGMLRTDPEINPVADILRYFELPHKQLYDVLQRNSWAIDPSVAMPAPLGSWPRLTGNSKLCFDRAAGIREELAVEKLDVRCLFVGLLDTEKGTARRGLERSLPGISLGKVRDAFLSCLHDPALTYVDALSRAVPRNADRPTRTSESSSGLPEASYLDQPTSIATGTLVGAGNDAVGDSVHLGFEAYVDAFARLITSPYTQPPLTVGVFGSWGMGKSFLLEHIEREVGARQRRNPATRPRVHVVRFNAWEYSSTDVVWPGLVRKIISRLDSLDTWPFTKRVTTRLRWNASRQWRRFRDQVLAGVLVAIGAVSISLLVGAPRIALTIGGVAALAGFVAVVRAATDPVAQWITELFADTSYGSQLGVMEEIRHDLKALERRLHTNQSDATTDRILVLVDDLDRCEPAKAVEILKAVNLLLNFPSFIVCVGIDARLVAKAIEKHYEGLIGESGASGYEYLEKIVQIPFRIPDPSEDDIAAFLSDQLGAPRAKHADERNGSGPPQATDTADIIESAPYDEAKTQGNVSAGGKGGVGSRDEEDRAFTSVESEAFEYMAAYLRPNPRHLKQIVNVYRLVRTLAQAESERFMLERPTATIGWLAMWSRWPYASAAILAHYDKLVRDGDGSEEIRAAEQPLLHLLDDIEDALHPSRRDRFDGDPAMLRRLVSLGRCQLSWEEIGRIRRYTMSFNPAVEEQVHQMSSSIEEGV